jgi:hypothetical protein
VGTGGAGVPVVVGGAVCTFGAGGGGVKGTLSGGIVDCEEGVAGEIDDAGGSFTVPGAGGIWILDSLGWEADAKAGSELSIESLSGFLVSANDL